MSPPEGPSGDGRQGLTPRLTRAGVRETAGLILDATGQRERARAARTTFARTLTDLGLKSGMSTGDYLEDWRRFMKLSTPTRSPGASGGARKRVAFVAPYGMYDPAVRATGVLSAALRVRGAEVTTLTCDRCLPACEASCIVDYRDLAEFLGSDRPKPCGRCHAAAEDAFDAFRLSRLPMSAYSSPELRREALETAERYRGAEPEDIYAFRRGDVALGKVVETSLFRFFLRGTLPDSEGVRAVALRYLRASIEVAGMMEWFIETWRPDVILVHDGVYLIGGTSLAVAESRGVERVAWDVGYRRSSVLASHKGSFVGEMRDDTSDSWDRPLAPDESTALTVYLDGRQRGAMDDMSHHPSPVEGRDAVVAATGLKEGERLVSLYTNVVWDARVYAPETLFHGPVEWMLETIRHVVHTPGVRYVVRVHPAEVKIPYVLTQERMDDQIRAVFPELPDNLVVIPPEDDLSSYSLAAASDLAVTYSSIIGLETMAMSVPTVVAGYPVYFGKGFGLEPPARSAYFHLLTHPDEAAIAVDDVEKARRYAFYFFFRRMLILPDIISASHTGLPRVRGLGDLRAGRYAGLDTMCSGILSGTPFETEDAAALEWILSGTAS